MKDNLNSPIYLYCHPISPVTPKDLPNVEQKISNYWSAKIIQNQNNEPIPMSEWFSLPKNNIHTILKTQPKGPFYIQLNEVSNKNLTKLFTDVKPIFKIQNKITRNTTNWIYNQDKFNY